MELALILSAVGCFSAILSEPHDASRLRSVKLPGAALAVEAPQVREEGPLIPQISRPIYRYAPVEYRDAFSPVTHPAAFEARSLPKPFAAPAHIAHFRDPFRAPVVAHIPRRYRVISAAQIPVETVRFRS